MRNITAHKRASDVKIQKTTLTMSLYDIVQVGRFGGVVVEAAGGSGLLVGAPYAGLGLANFGKVPTIQCCRTAYLSDSQFSLSGLFLQLEHRVARW
jgi:hypothetical protein